MRLTWHNYKYYPYERELAYREIAGLFADPALVEVSDGLELDAEPDHRLVKRLTYFSEAINGAFTVETLQSRLEGCRSPRKVATGNTILGARSARVQGQIQSPGSTGTIEYI